MAVNQQTIEEAAVCAVKEVLNNTGYIDVSYIQSGDKMPLYDGEIIIYNDKETRKNNSIYGRFKVQIKGTANDIEKSLTYRITKMDLECYFKDGGVLFFVIQVNAKNISERKKIFYIDLYPFAIQNLLKSNSNKSIKVPIKEMPKNGDEVILMLRTFVEHLNLQKAYTQIQLQNYMPELDSEKLFLNFHFLKNQTPAEKTNQFLNLETVIYAYAKNSQILMPYSIVKAGDIHIECKKNIKIFVNDRAYSFECEEKKSKNHSCFYIGKNIVFEDRDGQTKCNITFVGKLSETIYSLQFLLDMLEQKGFFINNTYFPILEPHENIKQKLSEKLVYLEQFKQALIECNVDDFDLKNLSNKDSNNIQILIQAFVDKKEISISKSFSENAFLSKIKICGNGIVIWGLRVSENTYRLYPFKRDLLSRCEVNGKNYFYSPYLFLKKEQLVHAININFDEVVSDMKQNAMNDETYFLLNLFILELLLAFDESNEKILLKTAVELAEYLCNQISDPEQTIIYKINLLQAKIRSGLALNADEQDFLHEILENPYKRDYKFAAYVLLKDVSGSNICFSKLDPETRENLSKTPIYTLWKELNNG